MALRELRFYGLFCTDWGDCTIGFIVVFCGGIWGEAEEVCIISAFDNVLFVCFNGYDYVDFGRSRTNLQYHIRKQML